MPLWTWKSNQDRPYLTCTLLPQPHGFFTQAFYPEPPMALAKLLNQTAQVYRVKQVHSGDVLTPTEIEQAVAAGLPKLEGGTTAPFPLADGIVTEAPNQAVWACSADCTPALISDIATGQVAAVHAGWRGTAKKILPSAIARLLRQGSQLNNLRVALGPAIDGSVYQVEHPVAAKVGATVATTVAAKSSTRELLNHLIALEDSPLLEDMQANRVRLDVRKINQMQLEQIGLAPEQIAIAPHCTYQEPDRFFSYRRTREKKVQWSGIVSH